MDIEKEIKKPLDFNNLCSICGCDFSEMKHTLPCNHCFHYDCILNYLQSEHKNINSTNDCPYCRQSFGYLPLLKGMKPIKYIHSEYKKKLKIPNQDQTKIKNKNQDVCDSYYLSGKNKGEKCNNLCINNTKFCRFHSKKN